MFKDKLLIFGLWIVIQMIAVFFKLSVAENVSWWIIFMPMWFIILSFVISEAYKEFKK